MAEIYAVVSEETAKRQIDALNRQLPVHKRINRIVARKEPFPRTPSGKIQVRPPTEAATAPISLPPLPKPSVPKLPEMPPFKAAPRTWLFWSVLLAAAAVLLFNLASLFCPTLKQRLSATINGLVDGTEILLSVFAILVVFVALKGRNLMMVYKRRKKK